MDNNKEEDIPAYLDYFTALYQDSETERCSSEKSSDNSPQHQDDDYDPTEESQSSDTFSSDDCEWLPSKRKKVMVRKRVKKRRKLTFGNESEPVKEGSEGSRQSVGYVSNPDASGEPSKTILRNILENPPAVGNSNIQGEKSKSVFYSPTLQALLMSNSSNDEEPSPNPKYNECKTMSDVSLPASTPASTPVDKTRNVVTGSASSLLMAMLKKANESSPNTECSGSASKINKPISISEFTAFDRILELAHSSRTPYDNTIPPDIKLTPDIKQRIKQILPQDGLNPGLIACDICKRKSSSTVCLRLPSVDNGVTDFKQWTVCEWCEVNVVGSSGIETPVRPESVDSINSVQMASRTNEGTEDESSSATFTRSSFALHREKETTNTDSDACKEWSQRVTRSCQKTFLDSLISLESWSTIHSGSTLTEILSDKSSKNVRPMATCTTHRRKGNPKKVIRNTSDPLVTDTMGNQDVLLHSKQSFGNFIVKLEQPDDFVELSVKSPEPLVNNNKLNTPETPHLFQSTPSIVVKKEPSNDYEKTASIEESCDIPDREVMQESSSKCDSEHDVLHRSADGILNPSTCTCTTEDHFVNKECMIASVSSLTKTENNSHNIMSEPCDDLEEIGDSLTVTFEQDICKMPEINDSSKDQNCDSNVDTTARLSLTSVTSEQEEGLQPAIESSLSNNEMLPAASSEVKKSVNSDFTVVKIKSEPIDVDYTEEILGSSSNKYGKDTEPKICSKQCISSRSLKHRLLPERRSMLESALNSNKSLKSHEKSHDLHPDSNKSDFLTSTLLHHKSQPKSSSMPKSSSLLLQQLCMSHHTKAASRSSAILAQHHDNSQNISSGVHDGNHLKSDASESESPHGETSSSFVPYNLSNLLLKLCYRSAITASPSSNSSVSLPNTETSTSEDKFTGLPAPSIPKTILNQLLPAPSTPKTILNQLLPASSTPKTILNQLFHKHEKQSASVTPIIEENKLKKKYSFTESALQRQSGKSKSPDGIQPRNVFQIGTKVLSEEKQQEPKDIAHSKTVVTPHGSGVPVRVSSRKSKQNKCNIDPQLNPLEASGKVVEKKVLDSLKPFVCMLCSESFETSNSLRIHMRYHKQDKAYGCGICGRKYSTNGVLKKHILTYHSITKNCE